MRQLHCPVCLSSPSYTPISGNWVLCSTCNLSWTYLAEELDLASLYRDEVYQVVDNRNSVFEKIIFSEAEKILLKAKKYHPRATRVLDFGAGKGQFLAVAKRMGWKAFGMESEPARGAFAKEKYQVPLHVGYYEGGKIGVHGFDLITLNHVLEHLPSPMELLRELLEQNLEKNGLLYLEVPRADSWQSRLAGASWMHWDIPKHLSHWTEATLLEQCAALGLKPVAKRSFSIHLGILGMLQALLSQVGWKENLILRLKKKKSLGLLLAIAFLLPLAYGIELLAVAFGKSGILGLYFRRK